MVWPYVIGAVASLAGGAMGNSAKKREAQRNRDFQNQQSSTAHQRQVADMRAAGLNPILSGMGGSGSATSAGAMAAQEDVITPGVNSAIATMEAEQRNKNMKQEESLSKQAENTSAAQEVLNDAAAEKATQDARGSIEQRKLIIEQTHSARELAKMHKNERISSDMDADVTQNKGEKTRRSVERWLNTIGIGSNTAKSLDPRGQRKKSSKSK